MNSHLLLKCRWLALLSCVVMAACTGGNDGADNNNATQGNVHIQAVLVSLPAQITRVVIAAADSPEISLTLEQAGATGWVGTLNNVSVGEHVFTVQAYNTNDEVIYIGTAVKKVESGDTNAVAVIMRPRGVTANSNVFSTPVINYLTSTMDAAGVVHLNAGVTDPNVNDRLTYKWTLPAGSGSFTDPNVLNAEWHPPGAIGLVQLTLTVTDSTGLSDVAHITVDSTDTKPNSFAFTPQENVALNAQITSNAVIITGITAPAAIRVENGSYSIDGGTFTTASGNINNGQSVRVQGVSAGTTATNTVVKLTIGGVQGLFVIRTVQVNISITSFTPTTVIAGQSLTIIGVGLEHVYRVVFANGVTQSPTYTLRTQQLSMYVPDTATSGVIRLIYVGGEVQSSQVLQIIPAIRVNAETIHHVSASGAGAVISGTGLMQVNRLRLGDVAVEITLQTDTDLFFNVPAGTTCAPILLESTFQPTMTAGSLIVGDGSNCPKKISAIEFAQILSQNTNDPYLKLVPGKRTWVRAYVSADVRGALVPQVRLTGFAAGNVLGTLNMLGPLDYLPVVGDTLPDNLRYDATQSFNVELPTEWVQAGLSVKVEVIQAGTPITANATPAFSVKPNIAVTVVPLVSGTFVPTMPATTEIRDAIVRRFPLVPNNITVTLHPTYRLTSVTDGVGTHAEWVDTLDELKQLRLLENAAENRFYYGFISRVPGTAIAGLGFSPGRASIGYDNPTTWYNVMVHEMGHNFDRLHAPCSNVADFLDSNYPYAGGVLSATPLVDSLVPTLKVVSPLNQFDVMSYCSPKSWFSDYNYREIQRYIETHPGLIAAQAALVANDVVEQDLLMVAGTINSTGWTLAPVQTLRGVLVTQNGNDRLRLVLADGSTVEYPMQAEQVADIDVPEWQFTVTVPRPKLSIARIEVLRNGVPVALRASSQVSALSAKNATVNQPQFTWRERNGQLTVQWDAAKTPYLAVTHVNGDTRRVLALRATGGSVQIDVTNLAPGGHYEFSISDGLNAHLIVGER